MDFSKENMRKKRKEFVIGRTGRAGRVVKRDEKCGGKHEKDKDKTRTRRGGEEEGREERAREVLDEPAYSSDVWILAHSRANALALRYLLCEYFLYT